MCVISCRLTRSLGLRSACNRFGSLYSVADSVRNDLRVAHLRLSTRTVEHPSSVPCVEQRFVSSDNGYNNDDRHNGFHNLCCRGSLHRQNSTRNSRLVPIADRFIKCSLRYRSKRHARWSCQHSHRGKFRKHFKRFKCRRRVSANQFQHHSSQLGAIKWFNHSKF